MSNKGLTILILNIAYKNININFPSRKTSLKNP